MMAVKLQPKPIERNWVRMIAGVNYFRLKRWLAWQRSGTAWARQRVGPESMPCQIFTHRTPLRRPLANVQTWLQENKVHNLRLALPHLDGLCLNPGETLSYWRCIGNPSRLRGYKVGMALHNGQVREEAGGGLCQLSNLIYWMTLHTPLTVTERWRHNFDVFPDADRTLPFASGATCFYNYIDLAVRNDTDQRFSLHLALTNTHLVGEWRSDRPVPYRYEVYESEHRIQPELWGGYTRHNTLRRRVFTPEGAQVDDQFITQNHAIMMYRPLLPQGPASAPTDEV